MCSRDNNLDYQILTYVTLHFLEAIDCLVHVLECIVRALLVEVVVEVLESGLGNLLYVPLILC